MKTNQARTVLLLARNQKTAERLLALSPRLGVDLLNGCERVAGQHRPQPGIELFYMDDQEHPGNYVPNTLDTSTPAMASNIWHGSGCRYQPKAKAATVGELAFWEKVLQRNDNLEFPELAPQHHGAATVLLASTTCMIVAECEM